MDEDQVPRLERFQAEHPEVAITAPGRLTGPFWRAVKDGRQITINYWLKNMLDTLEARCG